MAGTCVTECSFYNYCKIIAERSASESLPTAEQLFARYLVRLVSECKAAEPNDMANCLMLIETQHPLSTQEGSGL